MAIVRIDVHFVFTARLDVRVAFVETWAETEEEELDELDNAAREFDRISNTIQYLRSERPQHRPSVPPILENTSGNVIARCSLITS